MTLCASSRAFAFSILAMRACDLAPIIPPPQCFLICKVQKYGKELNTADVKFFIQTYEPITTETFEELHFEY